LVSSLLFLSAQQRCTAASPRTFQTDLILPSYVGCSHISVIHNFII
jgi:hypothetical protein